MRFSVPVTLSAADEVEGYCQFDRDKLGRFHFSCVESEIDYTEAERNGEPAVWK